MKSNRMNKELIAKIVFKIKTLREQKNISQNLFYIDTDIHIGRIETGKHTINITTIYKICTYFGISLSEFFSDIQ